MKNIARNQAKAAGMTKYFGTPCLRGHNGERWVSSNACLVCEAARKSKWNAVHASQNTASRKRWAQANPELHKAIKAAAQKRNREQANVRNRRYQAKPEVREAGIARNKAWREANPEQALAQRQKWVAENPERAQQYSAQWRKANPDKCAAHRGSARVKRANRAQCPWADKQLIKDFYKLASIYRDFGHDVHVDHIVPLCGKTVSGLHVHNNLQLLPASANKAKANHFSD